MANRGLMIMRVGALCLAFGACSSSDRAKPSSSEPASTPFIQTGLVALVTRAGAVHLTGKAGAISPGGSQLTARSLADGRSTHGSAAADGAFDLSVGGTIDDVLELTARRGAAQSEAVFASRAAVIAGQGSGGALTCDQREQLAALLIAQTADALDTACTTDADCAIASLQTNCSEECSDAIASTSAASALQGTIDTVNAALCQAVVDQGCDIAGHECSPTESGAAVCDTGACVFRSRCAGAPNAPGAGHTAGTLGLTFRTQRLTRINGPSNIGAVWIEDSSGNFIRTIELWAGRWASSLYHWQDHACVGGGPEVDAISEATLPEDATHKLEWDTRDLHGFNVADGIYHVFIEVAETELNFGPTTMYSFEKGGRPIMQGNLDMDAIQVPPLPNGEAFVPPVGVTISYVPWQRAAHDAGVVGADADAGR
jgi:hypothetical protein